MGLGAITSPMTVAAAALLTSAGACQAQFEFSGQVRPEWQARQPAALGPLAAAARLQPGIVRLPASSPAVEAELRASGHGLSTTVTLRDQRPEGLSNQSSAWVNELYAAGGGASWQFSAGKRIVAWDVGYGFRPNDFVQQSLRRTLLSTTDIGRPVLMAEHFDASTAWSFVLVNPTKPASQRGAEEPALAVRVYQRAGAVDWNGFVRLGAHAGGSVGAAAAWVLGDSLELHASARWLSRYDTLAVDLPPGGVAADDPWRGITARGTSQWLVGGTWTNALQVSVLAEAWWDGTALSDGQWDGWNARNRQLTGLASTGAVPLPALAGNLAWQTDAFANATQNLRRGSMFVRLSWQHDAWQPAVDVLINPADAGRVVTASLSWQGDRVRVDVGWRRYGGPSDAVLAQVPTRRVGYVAGTWAF